MTVEASSPEVCRTGRAGRLDTQAGFLLLLVGEVPFPGTSVFAQAAFRALRLTVRGPHTLPRKISFTSSQL